MHRLVCRVVVDVLAAAALCHGADPAIPSVDFIDEVFRTVVRSVVVQHRLAHRQRRLIHVFKRSDARRVLSGRRQCRHEVARLTVQPLWVSDEFLGQIEFLLRAHQLRGLHRSDDDHVALTLLLLPYLVGGAPRQLNVGRTSADLIAAFIDVPPRPGHQRLPLIVLYMLRLDVQRRY